jgi:hypothetical protein
MIAKDNFNLISRAHPESREFEVTLEEINEAEELIWQSGKLIIERVSRFDGDLFITQWLIDGYESEYSGVGKYPDEAIDFLAEYTAQAIKRIEYAEQKLDEKLDKLQAELIEKNLGEIGKVVEEFTQALNQGKEIDKESFYARVFQTVMNHSTGVNDLVWQRSLRIGEFCEESKTGEDCEGEV